MDGQSKDKELIILGGDVENIIYYNEENGYTVFDLSCDEKPADVGDIVTAYGSVPNLAVGEKLRVEGGWSFSARSLGKVNVQVIMESIGNKKDDGGGHQSMAGAQLQGITREEAVEKLHHAIDEYFSPVEEPQESEQQ